MARFVLAGLGIFLAGSLALATSDVPPRRAFFPLSGSLAKKLRKDFDLSIEELPSGLYYSHPHVSQARPEVTPTALKKRIEFDASYLVSEVSLRFMYGDSKWEKLGTKKFERDPKTGKMRQVPFNAFRWHAGMYENELWVVSPSGEKWLLMERNPVGSRTHFFMKLPYHFTPIAHGAIAVAKNGELSLLFVSGRSFNTFSYNSFQKSAEPPRSFTVAVKQVPTDAGDRRGLPLISYHEPTQKVMFAGWAGSHSPLEVKLGKRNGVFCLDTKTLEVTEILRGVSWPYALDSEGIYFSAGKNIRGKMFFRRFEWESEWIQERSEVNFDLGLVPEFNERELVLKNSSEIPYDLSADGKTTKVVQNPLARPSKENLHEIELLGMPPELLNWVRTGRGENWWHFPTVDQALHMGFSGKTRTGNLLVYDGEGPAEELLSSFLWRVDHKLLKPSKVLSSVSHVFLFRPEQWNKAGSKLSTVESLAKLRDQVAGKSVLLVFEDFAGLPSKFTTASLEIAKKRLTSFLDVFGACARNGTCRYVLTINRKLHRRLLAEDPNFLKELNAISMPSRIGSRESRRAISRCVFHKYSLNAGLTFSDYAFEEAFRELERERDAAVSKGKSDISQTIQFFKELTSFAIREGEETTIETTLVDKYLGEREKTSGEWKVDISPFELGRPPSPVWVNKAGDRNPVLPEDYFREWVASPERLQYSEELSHAVFRSEEALLLLRPDHAPVSVLKWMPILYVQLHPKGFFVLVESEGKIVLSRFHINFGYTNSAEGSDESPGTLEPLATDLPLEVFRRGDLTLRYDKGELSIRSPYGVRRFDFEGEISH